MSYTSLPRLYENIRPVLVKSQGKGDKRQKGRERPYWPWKIQ